MHYVVPYRLHRAWWVQVLLAVWRWSVELVLAGFLLLVVERVHRWTGRPVLFSAVLVVGVVMILLVVPRTRHGVHGVFWCLVTRHRLRTLFVEGRLFNPSGKLPWIVLWRPTMVGERCWLWLMPGLSVQDVQNRAEDIASACWARDARIERHKSNASLVRVDVIRRDPLTGGVLPSVLIPSGAVAPQGQDANARDGGDQSVTDRLHLPHAVIDLTDLTGLNGQHPDDQSGGRAGKPNRTARSDATSSGGRTRTSSTGSTASTGNGNQESAVRPVNGRGGEDISDYL